MDKEAIEKLMSDKCRDIIVEIRDLRTAVKAQGLLDSQMWINFEDELNRYSVMSCDEQED